MVSLPVGLPMTVVMVCGEFKVKFRAVPAGGLAKAVCWAAEAILILIGPLVFEKSRAWLGNTAGSGVGWLITSLPKLLPANWNVSLPVPPTSDTLPEPATSVVFPEP